VILTLMIQLTQISADMSADIVREISADTSGLYGTSMVLKYHAGYGTKDIPAMVLNYYCAIYMQLLVCAQ
jgi:hypothetical protein